MSVTHPTVLALGEEARANLAKATDLDATREEYGTQGRQIIRRCVSSLNRQFDRQSAGWSQESSARIRKYIDRANDQARRQRAERIAELKQDASRAARRIRGLQRDLQQLASIESGLDPN